MFMAKEAISPLLFSIKVICITALLDVKNRLSSFFFD